MTNEMLLVALRCMRHVIFDSCLSSVESEANVRFRLFIAAKSPQCVVRMRIRKSMCITKKTRNKRSLCFLSKSSIVETMVRNMNAVDVIRIDLPLEEKVRYVMGQATAKSRFMEIRVTHRRELMHVAE